MLRDPVIAPSRSSPTSSARPLLRPDAAREGARPLLGSAAASTPAAFAEMLDAYDARFTDGYEFLHVGLRDARGVSARWTARTPRAIIRGSHGGSYQRVPCALSGRRPLRCRARGAVAPPADAACACSASLSAVAPAGREARAPRAQIYKAVINIREKPCRRFFSAAALDWRPSRGPCGGHWPS